MSSYVFYFLGYYNQFSSLYTNAARTIRKVYDAVCLALSPTYYIFFSGVEYPCKTTVNLSAFGSAQPLWVYSPEQNRFFEWPMHPADTVEFKQLPILSLEVLDGEDTVYDLSEFVGGVQVHVRGDCKFYPSLSHIVNAWSLSSNIILNPRLKGRMIDTDANIVDVELNSSTLIRMEMDTVD
jgi:hypothetical protein